MVLFRHNVQTHRLKNFITENKIRPEEQRRATRPAPRLRRPPAKKGSCRPARPGCRSVASPFPRSLSLYTACLRVYTRALCSQSSATTCDRSTEGTAARALSCPPRPRSAHMWHRVEYAHRQGSTAAKPRSTEERAARAAPPLPRPSSRM